MNSRQTSITRKGPDCWDGCVWRLLRWRESSRLGDGSTLDMTPHAQKTTLFIRGEPWVQCWVGLIGMQVVACRRTRKAIIDRRIPPHPPALACPCDFSTSGDWGPPNASGIGTSACLSDLHGCGPTVTRRTQPVASRRVCQVCGVLVARGEATAPYEATGH